MSELVKLLNDLGRDAPLAEAYAKDPDPVLANYGLSDAEIKAMKSCELDQIRKISGLDELHMTNSTIKSY
ncbi:MAG: hypothetical protein LC637_00020 [Xanthomonadaceae bacterium]|nr:hypothetical protein [Xanthomonadaceae bacterium]